MAVVVRVKRRRNECQPQLLQLTCKKQKFEEEDARNEDSLKNVFKFAGTINSKNEKPLQVVKKAIGMEKLKNEYLKYQSETMVNSRSTHKRMALESRFKIISKKRAANFDKLEADFLADELADAKYQLIDLETENEDVSATNVNNDDDIICNGVTMSKSKQNISHSHNEAFVYDLFYTNNKCLDYTTLENILKIEAYREEELYVGYGENDEDDTLVNDEEDDENDEANWRNDYPDEDPKYYDSLDENMDYDDDVAGYGFDEDGGAAGSTTKNDLSEHIAESTEHILKDTLLIRGMVTTFNNFYR